MPGALLAVVLLFAAAPLAAQEAALSTDVAPGKSKSVRLRSVPQGANVAVRVVTSGRLLVALVGMKQLKQPKPDAKPVFRAAVQNKLTFRVTIPETDDYLLVLNNRRPDVVRAFFRRFVALYRERHGGESASWYGDQLALRDLIGLDHQAMQRQPLCEVDGVRVRFLPCDPFNFSPDNTWSAIASGLEQSIRILPS